ncbi:MAG: hypothetical protein OES35_08450 [Chromatiales bacterium]|jgi:hypothetical protein|nr:hypothetical protein [Chromatiales bacterium]MDH3916272.1 hypothetical protein [Chromatiales bacterium]
MKKMLVLSLSTLLIVAATMVPTSFAAEKSEFIATDLFNPLPLPGFPAPQIGEILAPPTIKCPGAVPTGNPEQPCPLGSRMHSRDGLVVSRLISDDPRVTGWLTVELNSNLDANFEGPSWGTFRIDLDVGEGFWEGTWQGYRQAYDGYWIGTINGQAKGYGGIVDGMKMNAEEEIMLVTALPIAYIGTWEGRIINPRK